MFFTIYPTKSLISVFCWFPPYRNMTSPYKPKKHEKSWKSDRTKFFFGNGLMEAKKWWELPIGFFYVLIVLTKKSTIFSIYKGYKKSYRELHKFFASISPFPMKNPVLKKSQKMIKKASFLEFLFSISRIFRLGIFMILRKKSNNKNYVFWRFTQAPALHLANAFTLV